MEARAHPAVLASMVVAAVAVTAAALVAIAYMLGWLPAHASLATPVGIANPAQQTTGVATDLALSPGESVVNPEEAPKPGAAPQPVTPSYAKPAPPKPAIAKSAPPKAAARQHASCANCGNIASITSYGRGEWDVRVRFADGSHETLRYREPPPFRLGERVRLEEGRLVRE